MDWTQRSTTCVQLTTLLLLLLNRVPTLYEELNSLTFTGSFDVEDATTLSW